MCTVIGPVSLSLRGHLSGDNLISLVSDVCSLLWETAGAAVRGVSSDSESLPGTCRQHLIAELVMAPEREQGGVMGQLSAPLLLGPST